MADQVQGHIGVVGAHDIPVAALLAQSTSPGHEGCIRITSYNVCYTKLLRFFALSEKERMVYLVGRRMGMFRGVADLANQLRRQQVEDLCRRNGVTPENVSKLLREIVNRFI